MSPLIQLVITIVGSVLASSGFWAWFSKKNERKDSRMKLLVGLAHDRITSLGMAYIESGEITRDEYENLIDYLYNPYRESGGNGTAEKIIAEVKTLPVVACRTVPLGSHKEEGTK